MTDSRIMLDDIRREFERNVLAFVHHEKTTVDHVGDDMKTLARMDELMNQICEDYENGLDEIVSRGDGGE